MRFRCPQCQSVVEGEPGRRVQCLSCGFEAHAPGGSSKAPVPASKPTPPVKAAPATAPAPAHEREPPSEVIFQADRNPAVWAYLLAIAAIGSFFLAPWGIPILFAAGAVGLGVWAFVIDHEDRRGVLAIIIGCIALVAAGIFFAV